jgi:nitrite reductase/ring-hydroxylating ferredoxin subunit
MTDVSAGRVEEFADPGRKVIEFGGIEIGVFKLHGKFTAYENLCPHLGGPACQGLMLPRTLDDTAQDNINLARSFSKTQHNVICPWHGMEFDIETGEHVTTKTLRLRKVAVRVEDGEVFVTVPDRKHQHLNASFTGERQRPARDRSGDAGRA